MPDDDNGATLYVDYVCPTHGTVCTIEPLGEETPTVPSEMRCAHDETSGGEPAICGQVAVYVARPAEGRDTEAGDPNPHPSGQAAERTRESA